MNLVSLEIPDDAAERVRWLERHLVGMDLARLVAELTAVHGITALAPASLRDVLGKRQAAVLEDGLSVLPSAAVGRLLQHPRLLLELQELVLTSGGRHWDRVAESAREATGPTRSGWKAIESHISSSRAAADDAPQILSMHSPTAWQRVKPWVVSFSMAAAVLVSVLFYQQTHPPAGPGPGPIARNDGVPPDWQRWTWVKSEMMGPNVSAGEFLDKLAQAADEWLKLKKDTPLELALRLGEFRQGCSAILLSPNSPLAEKDREWLRGQCGRWAREFDGYLAAVERGDDPLRVRTDADKTVRSMITSLHDRKRELTA